MHSLIFFGLGLSCFSFQSSINSILCSLIGHVLRRVVFLLSLFLDVTWGQLLYVPCTLDLFASVFSNICALFIFFHLSALRSKLQLLLCYSALANTWLVGGACLFCFSFKLYIDNFIISLLLLFLIELLLWNVWNPNFFLLDYALDHIL